MGLFDLFGRKKKQESAMDVFIRTTFGDRPPSKRANLTEAVALADTLMMGTVSQSEINAAANGLHSGPVPYSTHDLALVISLNFFKDRARIPSLRTAQMMARMTVLEWLEEKKVAPILVQTFEETLYKLYAQPVVSTVTAHILDPNTGYTTEMWEVGEHLPEEVVERLGEGDNIFVVVTYESGRATRGVVKRELWNQTKAAFDAINNRDRGMADDGVVRLLVSKEAALTGAFLTVLQEYLEAAAGKDMRLRVFAIEITYFSISALTYNYLQYVKEEGLKSVLDKFTEESLTKAASCYKPPRNLENCLEEYRDRFSRFSRMIHSSNLARERGDNDEAFSIVTDLTDEVLNNFFGPGSQNKPLLSLICQRVVADTLNESEGFVRQEIAKYFSKL